VSAFSHSTSNSPSAFCENASAFFVVGHRDPGARIGIIAGIVLTHMLHSLLFR
jgi:hypothetical protein